ncbi:MAG: hypothetical protein ABW075_10040, partial [Aeromicrobium sp.]
MKNPLRRHSSDPTATPPSDESRATDEARRREQEAPDPNDERKPDSPADLHKRSWIYVVRKTLREFSKDQCTDIAAALTYYSVLA